METAIATWEQHLLRSSKLSANTITEYIQDIRRFAAWLRDQECTATVDDLTVGDAKAYRDALLACGRSPATINRALTSLALFCDASGRKADNPFRIVDRVDRVEHAPQALKHRAWDAVRRAAEQASRRDHGLTLALVCLMRFAGLRVGEVAALEGPDLLLSPRRGTVIVRRGKGLKHREIPLISDAREPLLHYQDHRRQLAERWAARALAEAHIVTVPAEAVVEVIDPVAPATDLTPGSWLAGFRARTSRRCCASEHELARRRLRHSATTAAIRGAHRLGDTVIRDDVRQHSVFHRQENCLGLEQRYGVAIVGCDVQLVW
jgi:site-specific recombinase XerD